MTLSVEELGIMVLISCIQTTQYSPFLHNQGEIVRLYCNWEIRVSTSGFELELWLININKKQYHNCWLCQYLWWFRRSAVFSVSSNFNIVLHESNSTFSFVRNSLCRFLKVTFTSYPFWIFLSYVTENWNKNKFFENIIK